MRIHALIPVLVFAACMSAEKRYEQAIEDESQGRWVAAARKYLDVLRRDPEYPGAREKAAQAGDRAVADYLTMIGELEAAGQLDRASQEYDKLDALVAEAVSVGVVLNTPAGYRDRRAETFRRAFEAEAVRADALLADGQWSAAIDVYSRAERRFKPTAEQLERSTAGRFDALLVGARAELTAGRYKNAESLVSRALSMGGVEAARSREAHALLEDVQEARYQSFLNNARAQMEAGSYEEALASAEEAIAVFGEESPRSGPARELHALILEEATIHVAPIPVWHKVDLGDLVAVSLIRSINRTLAKQHWTEPPPLVAVTEAGSVREALRTWDLDRTVLTDRQARAVAHRLAADVAVVSFLSQGEARSAGGPRAHAVFLRDGQKTTIKVWERRMAKVRCSYHIVSVEEQGGPGRRSPGRGGYVDAMAQVNQRHALYAGDVRNLRLTPEEHSWFDDTAHAEIYAELEREIAQQLASKLAAAVYADVSKMPR